MKYQCEFMGRPTGDGESFCWEVDKENFIKATNKYPNESDYVCEGIENGKLIYSKTRLYFYPDHIFNNDCLSSEFNKPARVKIEWEEV